MQLDRITLSLLAEFSTEFGIEDMEESNRFEQFSSWLAVRRHFSESTFLPFDIHTGGDGDGGIDAIAIIANNNLITDIDMVGELLEQNGFLDVTFVLVQAKRSAHFDGAKIGAFGFAVRDFFGDSALPRNKDIEDYCQITNAIYAHASKFSPGNPSCYLYYVTTGTWQDDATLRTRLESEKALLVDTNLFSRVEFNPVGAPDIQRLYRQAKNDITKEFSFDKKQSVPNVTGVKESYLGFITARELLKIVRDEEGNLIKGLFYENIRDWQGYGHGGINDEIRETLSSDSKDRFVLMNNGVTIIARSLKTTADNFTISGFYVVNGCQTCNVLHENEKLLDDEVRVPLRLVSTQESAVVESIIRATNRQTEVKEDQFFAMTPFAKRLEEYFKAVPVDKRLYYERRSNQYDAEKIERQRIVVHQNLVRSVGAMFLGDAHITTKNFRTLRAQVGEQIFNDLDRMEPTT